MARFHMDFCGNCQNVPSLLAQRSSQITIVGSGGTFNVGLDPDPLVVDPLAPPRDLLAASATAKFSFTADIGGVTPIVLPTNVGETSGTANIAGSQLFLNLDSYTSAVPLTLINAGPGLLSGMFGSVTFLGSRTAMVNYDVASGDVTLTNFAGSGSLAATAVPEPSGLWVIAVLGLTLFTLGEGILRQRATLGDISVSKFALNPSCRSDLLPHGPRLRLLRCCVLLAVLSQCSQVWAAAGRQFSLGAIDLLPNAPSTYELRDWHKTATDFDTLAFNTAATGQFLPIVKIDNTPVSSQLAQSFGLAAYVGDPRTFGETGEPVHEAVASLAAVLGGTLVGIDKSAGQYNWVNMSREYYVDRNSQYIILNNPFAATGGSAWYETYPSILAYSIADRYQDEAGLQTALNTVDTRFYAAVDKLTASGTAPNFNYTAFNFKTMQPVYNGTWREPDMGLGMAWLQHAAYQRNRDTNPAQAANYLNAVDWALAYYENLQTNPDYEILLPFGAYTAARMNAEHGRNYDVHKLVRWVFDRSNARPTKIMITRRTMGRPGHRRPDGLHVSQHGSDVRGYAFSMNTFATAMPMVPLARYEDRYSRAIGKWMRERRQCCPPVLLRRALGPEPVVRVLDR